MSIQGPGIIFRLRAGGSCPGLANTRSGATATYRAHSGLLKTAAANLLRLDWVDTAADGILNAPTYRLEPAATNLALWCRDCTNAAWTKTTMTATKTQIGIDGVASSASVLTATAGNATCLQGVTSGSASRSFAAYVRRIAGSGTINMTMDGGSTWTVIVPTNVWQRFAIPTQVVTNPSVGWRIVSITDAIAVDYCQLESTKLATTPILTTSASATRNADTCTATFSYRPQAMTLYAFYVAEHIDVGTEAVISRVGDTAGGTPHMWIGAEGGTGKAKIRNVDFSGAFVESTAGSAPTAGQFVEVRGVLNANGSVLVGQSIAGAAEVVGATSAPDALSAAWYNPIITIGGIAANPHAMGLRNLLVLAGVRDLNACRGLI